MRGQHWQPSANQEPRFQRAWCDNDTGCTAHNIALLIASEHRNRKEEDVSVLKHVWNAGLTSLSLLLVRRDWHGVLRTPSRCKLCSLADLRPQQVQCAELLSRAVPRMLQPLHSSSNHCRKQFTRFITHWFYWPLQAASLISISYINVLNLPTPHEGSDNQS